MDNTTYTITFTNDELRDILRCGTVDEARQLVFYYVRGKLLDDFYRGLIEEEDWKRLERLARRLKIPEDDVIGVVSKFYEEVYPSLREGSN